MYITNVIVMLSDHHVDVKSEKKEIDFYSIALKNTLP